MILGVDPGARRVGLAVADEATRVAVPLSVIEGEREEHVDGVLAATEGKEISLIVVGRPVGLSGRAGPAVQVSTSFVAALRDRTRVPVVEWDERLTTVLAEKGLRAAGGRKVRRSALVDSVAAQLMLQGYLDANPAEPADA